MDDSGGRLPGIRRIVLSVYHPAARNPLDQQGLQHLEKETAPYVRQEPAILERLRKEDPQMGHLADYLREYAGCPVYDRTEAVFYPLGDLQFPAMVEKLKKAKSFIFLEYFIVEKGIFWDTILDILEEKVKEGVEVRVLYDGMCVLALLPYFYPEILEKKGIRCKMFSPIRPLFSSHYNNRDHRKILVIDGNVVFTGGTNLADEYINRKERFGHWKDTAVMLRGKAAECFTYMFLEMWNVSEKNTERYETYRTPAAAAAKTDGYVIPYKVNPLGNQRTGKRVYLDILYTAETYVHIMTPYLILDYEMMMALIYAAQRGVEVSLIMPHIPDKTYAFAVAKTYYNDLLEAGIQIYEYTPGFVHAKVFVSDDVKAVVGTVNMDYRSFYHHFECGTILYGNSQVKAIEEDFRNTREQCRKVTVSDYGRQSLAMRFTGRVMRIFAPLMGEIPGGDS